MFQDNLTGETTVLFRKGTCVQDRRLARTCVVMSEIFFCGQVLRSTIAPPRHVLQHWGHYRDLPDQEIAEASARFTSQDGLLIVPDLQADMFWLDDIPEMVEHVHRKATAGMNS